VSTFIDAFDEIAPAAIHAGQQAKSIMVFPDERLAQVQQQKTTRTIGLKRVALTEMRRIVTAADSLDGAIAGALTFLKQVTPSQVCAMYEYQRDRDSFECIQAVGDPSESLAGLVISNGDRITGWAGANRQIAVNSDAVLDLGPLAELFNPPLRRAISCPIQINGQTPAVITIYCDRDQGFDKIHIDALEQVSETIALRLRARQESEVLI
jgi:transcriptional regulator with GAF, ATPase, and Fis domain